LPDMTTSQRQRNWLLTSGGVTWLSVFVNILLTGAKVVTGVLFHSQTVLADGLHSATDLVTDVAVLGGLRISGKPADRTHLYGHRRVSTLVAMFVGGGLWSSRQGGLP